MSHRIRVVLLASLAAVANGAAASAGDFVFDVPQILGEYLGDDSLALPPVEVALDLGMTFAEIDSATLHYTGLQTVGAYGDLNRPGEWALPASLLAFSNNQDQWLLAESVLPAVSGPYDVADSFRRLGHPNEPADFSDWLDGQIDFTFSAAPLPLIATTYVISTPAVKVQTAQLVISGQPNLDAFMLRGDFNGDGSINGADEQMWEAALGISADADANQNGMTDGDDLLIWQQNVDRAVRAASVPEPGAVLLAFACLGGWLRFLRSSPSR